MRLSSDIGSIVGICVVTLFFSMLPSWREIEWHAALDSLFIIYKGGICIYQHNFRKLGDISNNQTVVVGNVIEIIKSLIQKGTSGRLKVIDFNEKKILLEQGDNVIVAMIAEVETESLNFLLHKFLILFERFFHDILEEWQGDNVEFEPTKALIQEIFG